MKRKMLSPAPSRKAHADKVKELGGSIEIKEYPNDDPFSLPNSSAPDAREWLSGLF